MANKSQHKIAEEVARLRRNLDSVAKAYNDAEAKLAAVRKLIDEFDQLPTMQQNDISGYWVAVQVKRALEATA